jgi:hypothetical protein
MKISLRQVAVKWKVWVEETLTGARFRPPHPLGADSITQDKKASATQCR